MEAIENQVESGAGPGLEQAYARRARLPGGREEAHQEGGRAADLVGLGGDVERFVQLGDMRGEHQSRRWPGLLGWVEAAKAWIEPLQLRRPVRQDDPEEAGEQAELDHRACRCVLPAATDLADRAAVLPVVGHRPHQMSVEVPVVSGV